MGQPRDLGQIDCGVGGWDCGCLVGETIQDKEIDANKHSFLDVITHLEAF